MISFAMTTTGRDVIHLDWHICYRRWMDKSGTEYSGDRKCKSTDCLHLTAVDPIKSNIVQRQRNNRLFSLIENWEGSEEMAVINNCRFEMSQPIL